MTNTINPGCVDPANQAFVPPPLDRTGSPTSSKNLPVTSNGEIQPRYSKDVLHPPSVVGGSGAVAQSDGEIQLRDLRRAETAPTTCVGLPLTTHAGTSRPGRGLPANVTIK
jgi:hypothetical protein